MIKKSSCLLFDKRILVLLCICYIQNVTSFWEYAICTEENIMLFDRSWKQLNNSKFSIEKDDLKRMKSITYDVKNDLFYFTNNQKGSRGIYKLKVFNETSYEISKFLVDRDDDFRDLVFDAVDDTLYWSDAKNEKIFRLKMNPQGKVETFLDVKFDVEGIEIDSCGRNLFFVQKYNEKVNVVSLNDELRDPTEIGVGQHDRPVTIALDHQSRRLYVADIQQSVHYSIDSILTNGSDFRREVDSAMRNPKSIAVDSEFVYYVDGDKHELRQFTKKSSENQEKQSILMKKFKYEPQDIIVRSNFVTDLDSKLCQPPKEEKKIETTTKTATTLPLTTTETCSCPLSLTESCKIDRCSNFCLNGGKCSEIKNEPKCACNQRYSGDRCEVDLCMNFCLNGGECSVKKSQPKCKCNGEFIGDRCEKSKIDANKTEKVPENLKSDELLESETLLSCEQNHVDYTHVIVAGCVTLSLLMFLIIVLVLKKMQRPLRPRVKKTYKVHKNIEPLTYRPHTEHCEVVIEDCCNMNICETPCYDPKLLQKEFNESNLSVKLMPSSKCSSKEDKQDLLKNMEFNQ